MSFVPSLADPSSLQLTHCSDIIVLFPFHIPIYVPNRLWHGFLDALSGLRIILPRQKRPRDGRIEDDDNGKIKPSYFRRFRFPLNFVTAPLIADLFLLALTAIHRDEVYAGTIGAENISPIDIMVFFLSLAYIAISIDASGLIRYLAFRVLLWGGEVGHRLFFYLYLFFFGLGSFIGNDPIILSGTAFLAYMTRVSSNIVHPRAWIHTQFAVANIASAILVSSNPTNLVLSGAFGIRFIVYTAHMIVPVVATVIVLFPFLLYIVFADESLIPISITMHSLPERALNEKPVNPNIPNARGNMDEEENENNERGKVLSLTEIMNPFLDKGGAAFGAVIMVATLIAILACNASGVGGSDFKVFWVTLPAAFIMFCWDLASGWLNRKETRKLAADGRQAIKEARDKRKEQHERPAAQGRESGEPDGASGNERALALTRSPEVMQQGQARTSNQGSNEAVGQAVNPETNEKSRVSTGLDSTLDEKADGVQANAAQGVIHPTPSGEVHGDKGDMDGEEKEVSDGRQPHGRTTLVSLVRERYSWAQETFPTVMAVLAHLPFALVPFAFCMFILVQGLVTRGWVPVFAYGWDHWVNKTGTVGAVGGMAFLSVILCNVS